MNIVLVWAGGTGLSSLGFLFADLGITDVVCIDSAQNQITDALGAHGYNVIIGHNKYTVKPTDFVIYSDACPSAPEVLAAQKYAEENSRKPRYPVSYFQFLGEISKHFETIAIAGTHGKSTSTALATYTLSQLDNSLGLWILGALVPQLGNKNYRLNSSAKDDIRKIFDYILEWKQTDRDETLRKKYRFIIEADEFNRHFLLLDVDHAIVLNAELDHSDIYKNDEEYFEAFHLFGDKVKKNIWVIQGEKGIDRFTEGLKNDVVRRITPYDISLQHIFGAHNWKNASLVYALTATMLGRMSYDIGPDDEILGAMNSFTGLRRRMEFLRTNDNWAEIYTDYGHHPSEINAVYHAMRGKYADKKLTAIVQPHQMRRVLEFWNEWVHVLKQFDTLFLYPIYAAREDIAVLLKEFENKVVTQAANAEDISLELAMQTNATYITDTAKVKEIMDTADGDTVVVMFTAGNLDYQMRNLQ